MEDKTLRIFIAAQLTAMYLHPGNRKTFEACPLAHIQEAFNIADTIMQIDKLPTEDVVLEETD